MILASIGIAVWHRETLSQSAREWGRLAVRSVVLGLAFFGGDFLIALFNGHANPFHFPGGLLGLPLTFLICPGATMICLAGLARASYRTREKPGTRENPGTDGTLH
jgi:hypothetical protein